MAGVRVWTAALGLLLSTCVFVVVGCGGDKDRPAPANIAEPPKGAGSQPLQTVETAGETEGSGRRLLADWPEEHFEGALLLTGEMLGYQEPCGCAAKQKGGLVRRAIFVELLRRQGWKLALADLGSLIPDPSNALGGPDQTKLKLSYSLRALGLLGYSAIALSAEDLRQGVVDSLMQFENAIDAHDLGLSLVAANATSGLGKLQPSVRVPVGNVSIGLTAVLDPATFETLKDPEKAEFLTVAAPDEALGPVLADLETDTTWQVLMVQGPPELARRLAESQPGFDIVLSTSDSVDPPAQPEQVNDGKTWLVQVGQKGMYVGVVGLYTDGEPRLRYRRIELNDGYERHRELAQSMRALIGDEFQNSLKTAAVLERFPKRPYALFNAPADATYVGVETCRACHPNTVKKWESTKHARAYEPLISDPRDAGRNRENDAACITCHTTGFEYIGGFTTLATTPHLKGNQCENCHGPGSRHAAAPADLDLRAAMKRSRDDFDSNHRCVKCHDTDNDPHFNFATYWPRIMHSKLDTYDDPRVHQGIAPVLPRASSRLDVQNGLRR